MLLYTGSNHDIVKKCRDTLYIRAIFFTPDSA